MYIIFLLHGLMDASGNILNVSWQIILTELPLSINIGNVLLLIVIVCMLVDGLLFVMAKEYSSDDDESA